MSRASIAVAAATALALVAGAAAYWRLTSPDQGGVVARGGALTVPEAGVGRLFETTLSDHGGKPVAFSAWRGRVLVVNFWATWCPPCLREMPELSESSVKYAGKGVQFVGIGIDSPSAIKEYVYRRPVSYPILVGGTEGLEVARALGNVSGALPFTVIIDASGRPVFARLGEVDARQLDQILGPLAIAD